MVTTIQLSEEIKAKLGNMKEGRNETYEDVIIRIVKKVEILEKGNKNLLKQGYEEMAAISKKVDKEWSATDRGWE